YAALARSMGVPGRRITAPGEIAPALREALAAGGPRLIEVMVADGFGT
ncbi:MAG: thiamine pyrophosphate-dependent enzyme, partial [Burkholderiales bacterium]